MLRKLFIMQCLAFITLFLGACANPPPISANPVQDVKGVLGGNGDVGDFITTDLQNQSWNLHQAVQVGALDAKDPAPGCVDSFLTQIGVAIPDSTGSTAAADNPVAPSFTPKITGAFSAGAVLYIRAQQAKAFANNSGLTISSDCAVLIVNIERDALKAGITGAASLVPGSALLKPITKLLGGALIVPSG